MVMSSNIFLLFLKQNCLAAYRDPKGYCLKQRFLLVFIMLSLLFSFLFGVFFLYFFLL